MAVNKVIFGDKTIIDISDSSVTANKLLYGEIAYDATGARIVGTYLPVKEYDSFTNHFIDIPSESWKIVDGKYSFKISSEINPNFINFAQVCLSDGYEYEQNEQFDLIQTIHISESETEFVCFDGDTYPYCDLRVMITSINVESISSIESLNERKSRNVSIRIPKEDWKIQNGIDTIEFSIDIGDDEIAFIEPILILSDDDLNSVLNFYEGISESASSNGSIILSRTFDESINKKYDLNLVIRIFKEG